MSSETQPDGKWTRRRASLLGSKTQPDGKWTRRRASLVRLVRVRDQGGGSPLQEIRRPILKPKVTASPRGGVESNRRRRPSPYDKELDSAVVTRRAREGTAKPEARPARPSLALASRRPMGDLRGWRRNGPKVTDITQGDLPAPREEFMCRKAPKSRGQESEDP